MIQLTQQIKTEWEDTIRCAWWVCWSHLLIHCKEYRDRIWPALTPSVTLTTCRWDLLPGRCWASNTNSDRCICIMTGNNNVLSKWWETLACYLCLLWLLWDTESFLPAKELLVRRLFKLFHQDTVFPLARLHSTSKWPRALGPNYCSPPWFPKGWKCAPWGDKNFLLLQHA